MSTVTQEQLYQQIIQNAPEAIIFVDREGNIGLWNSGAAAIFGYSAEEALGQQLDLIIPERQRKRHWEGFHKTMQTGVTKYGAELLSVPALRKDGTRISIEFSIVLIRDEAGRLTGVTAIMRDVTARRQQEQALKERLAGLETKA